MSYTSAQLLKAVKSGIKVRITIAGEPTGGAVVFRPRYKNDRAPWVYTEVNGNTNRYPAKHCAPVRPIPSKAANTIRKAVDFKW